MELLGVFSLMGVLVYFGARAQQSLDERDDMYDALWPHAFPDLHELRDLYDYKKLWHHYWMRVTFRNPWSIYTGKLKTLIDREGSSAMF